MRTVSRTLYLERIKERMHNGLVKIITGPRRSGKSWLLSKIFTQYLISLGVEDSQIIHISFDLDDENNQSDLLNPSALKDYLYTRITDADKQMAHKAIGDYGPLGRKYTTDEFLKMYK